MVSPLRSSRATPPAVEHGLGGRRFTAWPSLWGDLRRAGAEVLDEEVAIDGQFTTSRSPSDLPAFCAAIVEQFAKVHQSTA